MMKTFESKEKSLKKLSGYLLEFADTFSFIVRKELPISSEGMQLIKDIQTHLILEKKVTEWPGTKLLGEEATLYLFQFTRFSCSILLRYEDDLLEWVQPHLPEDLVFYKEGIPFFITITHESEAYFKLDEKDKSRFTGILDE